MNILLIEDEAHVSAFIKKGLEEASFHVDVAFDGYIGKVLALQNSYDLFILDVILPQINGLELCRIFRAENLETPILMLTALGSTDDIVAGLSTGADDYLVKPFKFKELLARIDALMRRKENRVINPVFSFAGLEINDFTKEVKRNGHPIKLTPREFFLLKYFIENRGRVKTRTQIAESVWGNSYDTGSNVVDVYVNYLRNKIDKDFSPRLIHTVTGMGYIFKEGEE
ncbi:MAG: response regulator transcription factor [Bacteroidetes bacterium]|nr:response regulator transcription factor [Bacteroidota bacterium]